MNLLNRFAVVVFSEPIELDVGALENIPEPLTMWLSGILQSVSKQ
jgi:hypothetical protein